jgi:membrane protease YdiL (CAAX protease family)
MKVLTMVLKDYLKDLVKRALRTIFPSTLLRASAGQWIRVVLRRNLNLICTAYLLFIACAELLIIYNTKIGIALHVIILFALLLHSTLESDKDKNFSRFLMALVFVPLIRILSLSMPLAHFSRISWFLLISIPIFIAIFICMWVQKLRPKEIGLFVPALRNTPIEAGVILFAIPLGIIEYQILKPSPLPGLEIASFITSSLIFIICTGFVEELVFRGLIQYNTLRLTGAMYAMIARKTMRKWSGIIFVTSIFAVLHISNLSPLDCLLAFSVGVLYSVVREKTGSIYGISVSHGIINILVFLVAPVYF